MSEDAGILRCFTARDYDVHWTEVRGRLVGYALYFVRANPHYKSSVQAVQDVLYLDPSVRGGSVVPRFLLYCDEQLRAEGVQAAYHHLKAAHNHERLMRFLGYEVVDVIYAKRLDAGPIGPVDRPSAIEALDEAFI